MPNQFAIIRALLIQTHLISRNTHARVFPNIKCSLLSHKCSMFPNSTYILKKIESGTRGSLRPSKYPNMPPPHATIMHVQSCQSCVNHATIMRSPACYNHTLIIVLVMRQSCVLPHATSCLAEASLLITQCTSVARTEEPQHTAMKRLCILAVPFAAAYRTCCMVVPAEAFQCQDWHIYNECSHSCC